MNLNHSTASMLKAGVFAGLGLIVIGLCTMYMELGDHILYAGILVLILSPFLGSIVSLACLIAQKDRFWSMIAAILIIITTAGIAINVI